MILNEFYKTDRVKNNASVLFIIFFIQKEIKTVCVIGFEAKVLFGKISILGYFDTSLQNYYTR